MLSRAVFDDMPIRGADVVVKRSGDPLPESVSAQMKQKKKRRDVTTIHLKRAVSWRLQNLFESCLRTFKGPGTVPSPPDVLNLCRILDGMNSEDVGLRRNLSFFQPKSLVEATPTPRVTSAKVYKCHNFEICIFFLPAKALIPLHNHPQMTVFSKLLVGTMHIKAYDWAEAHQPHMPNLPSKIRLARLKANKVFGAPCETCVLYPTSGGNIHEFEAISPCVLLDVLGPPYSNNDGQECTYFREVGKVFSAGYRFLEEIEIPHELEIDGIEYMGPKIVVNSPA